MNGPLTPSLRIRAVLLLTRAHLLEFFREPGILFWAFGFPLLLSWALGLAVLAPHRVRVTLLVSRTDSVAVRAALRTVSRATRKRLIQDLAFLDELMRLLRRRGKRRKPTQTPREFVVETCQNVAVVKDDALWLVDRFYELRLGNGRLSPQLRAQIATRLTRIRKSC